jgi:surface antigen
VISSRLSFTLLLLLIAGCSGGEAPPPAAPHEPLYLSLTAADAERADKALQQALETKPSGQGASWTNSQTGASGSVTPWRTFRDGELYCREFTELIVLDGREDRYRLTGCRDEDGVWRPR